MKLKNLSNEQIQKLVIGQAGLSNNYFSGDLYNGNADINICQIIFNLTTTEKGKKVQREYLWYAMGNYAVEPLRTKHFSFKIIVDNPYGKYAWEIIEAKTCVYEK